MTFTYTWDEAEQITLRREDADGNVVYIPSHPGNPDYAAFLASGETAADYVAPPEPEPLTTEEKMNRLLSDYGLNRNELKAALAEDVAEKTAAAAPKTKRKR